MKEKYSLIDAIVCVLREAGTELHYHEITDRVIERGAAKVTGKTPERTVSARLVGELRKKDSRLYRASRGVYSFKCPYSQFFESLDDYEFETLVANIVSALGYEEVKQTQATRDGGYDVMAISCTALYKKKVAIEVKHYKAGKVAKKAVREFRGALRGMIGIMVTSSYFTGPAIEEANAIVNEEIYLIDRTKLINILKAQNISLSELKANVQYVV